MLYRFSLLPLFFITSLLGAGEQTYQTLGSVGQPGWRYVVPAGDSGVALSPDRIGFLQSPEPERLNLAATQPWSLAGLDAFQRDGDQAWVQFGSQFLLVTFDDETVSVPQSLRQRGEVRWWHGNRSYLVIWGNGEFLVYEPGGRREMTLRYRFPWRFPIASSALAGSDVVIQTRDHLHVQIVNSRPDAEAAQLEAAPGARWERDGFGGFEGTVVAVDQGAHALYQWRKQLFTWQPPQQVPLTGARGTVRIRYLDQHRLALTDAADTLWLFDLPAEGPPVLRLRQTRRVFEDLAPLEDGTWLMVQNGQVVRTTVAGPNQLGHLAVLAESGKGGDLVCRDNTAFWLHGGALQVVDIANPAAPVVLASLQLGTVSRLRLADDLLVAMGDGLHLVDVSNPAQPRLQSVLSGRFDTFDTAGETLVAAGVNRLGEGQLALYDLSHAGGPRLIAGLPLSFAPRDLVWDGRRLHVLGADQVAFDLWDADRQQFNDVEAVVTRHGDNAWLVVEDTGVLIRRENGGVYSLAANSDGVWVPVWDRAYATPDDPSPLRPRLRDNRLWLGGRDLRIFDQQPFGEPRLVGVVPSDGVAGFAFSGSTLLVSERESGLLRLYQPEPRQAPLYVPWVSNRYPYTTKLKIMNPNIRPALVTLRPKSDDPNLSHSLQREVAAFSVSEWDADELFPVQYGYALEITSAGPPVTVYYTRQVRDETLVLPAMRADQAGSELVFPSLAAHLRSRVMVVLPLAPDREQVTVRVDTYAADGVVVYDSSEITLKANRANAVFQNTSERTRRYRITAEPGVALLGEETHVRANFSHYSLHAWSPDRSRQARPAFEPRAQWDHPLPEQERRAVAASGSSLALAGSDTLFLLTTVADGVVVETRLEGFADIRDLAMNETWLVVLDHEQGVLVYPRRGLQDTHRPALMPIDGAVQVALLEGEASSLVVGAGDHWGLYDLGEEGAPRLQNRRAMLPGTRFGLGDGLAAVITDVQRVDVFDLRDPARQLPLKRYDFENPLTAAEPKLVVSGDWVLLLEPGRGLFALEQRDGESAVLCPIDAPLAAAVAVGGGRVFVADGGNGLKTYAIGGPNPLTPLALSPNLQSEFIAAAADVLWLVDGDGRVQVQGPTQETVPQVVFPYVPLGRTTPVLDLHQNSATATRYRIWENGNATEGMLVNRFGSFTLGEEGAESLPWTTLALDADHPLHAWFPFADKPEYLTPGLRDNQFGSQLHLPLSAAASAVTIVNVGAESVPSLQLRLLRENGLGNARFVRADAGASQTVDLAELFDAAELSDARGLRLSGPGGSRLGAVLHRVENGSLRQLMAAEVRR
ncbi:hypothetical protein [Acanthopleuribacter pedis]|uniref:Uncharacterized protein n=1 Tax=Acanthopleuribacter pedis TaxID=442870 RepID=A0A8J7U263_9BACT|nr:hypothetical protein [Acanthopleuribacter pedis]MBO1317384.1 hypothetical protein [Acanthopleuribacter pedis]